MPERARTPLLVTTALDRRFPMAMRRFRHVESPQSQVPHAHAHLELALCEGGHGSISVAGATLPFAAGEAVLIGGGRLHAFSSAGAGSDWIIIHAGHAALHGRAGRAVAIGLQAARLQADRLLGYARDLAQELARRERGWEAVAVALLDALLLCVDRSPEVRHGAVQTPLALRRLAPALDFIRRRQAQRFTTAAVAASVGVSCSQLRRLFAEGLGCTPKDFLRNCRLETACDLLARSDRPVTAIAFAVGYESLSGFNRDFRRAHGQPPTLWRRGLAPGHRPGT
jgi:AraC-like DNA-binding protein